MNETKFTELVNAYFDREITDAELASLRQELTANAKRRQEFKTRYYLHKATRAALSVESVSNVKLNESAVAQGSDGTDFPGWFLGFGIAACVMLSFFLSVSLFNEPARVESQFSGKNPLTDSDIERYVENQMSREQLRGSLASQLRLVGLTPDIAPSKPQLGEVDMESLLQSELRRQRAIDRINPYKVYSAHSKLQSDESLRYPNEGNNQYQTAGFKSSLASF